MHAFVLCLVAIAPRAEVLRADDVPAAIERLVALRSAHDLEAAGRAPDALSTLAPFAQGDDPLAIAIQFHAARLRLVLGEIGHPSLVSFFLRPASEVRWGITRRQEADALLLLSHRLRQAGRDEDAASVLEQSAIEYPRWVELPPSLTREQRRTRADNLVRDMDYEGALGELEALLGDASERERRELQRTIGHLIGDKMRDDYARVRDIYRDIADRKDATIDDLFYLAYATGKVDPSAAVEVYREIIHRFPEDDDVDQARFFIAWTEFDLERLESAMRAFDRYLAETPDSGYRFAVRWYRGLAAFRLERYDEALREFRFTARYTSKNRDKGRYWTARTLRQLGRRVEAEEIFYELAEHRPFSYYGMLARALLPEDERPPVFEVSTASRDVGLTTDEAYAALDELSEHSHALVTEAFAAQQMGWPGLAAATVAYIGELRGGGRAPLRNWLQRRLGIAHRAVRSRETRKCRSALDEDPSVPDVQTCWRRVFPTPFARVIDEVRGELPATVFWSIMRQESYYQPTARSHADALGLMQLIPQVGGPAAAALGRTFAPYELYEPETNLRLFALAAHERVRRFAGHVPLILMSYNATPEKTEEWLRNNHELPFDLFVEEIPWSETRGYVKHISVNLARYETLLGDDAELLERAHLPQPTELVEEAFGDALHRITELASAE